jgi:hypothetical protein
MMTTNELRIVVFPGDGIGIEVMDAWAEIGDHHALFQPAHGTAPDIAGAGNFPEFRQPKSNLAADQHVSPLLRPLVSDDPYRLYRNPLVPIGLGALFTFLLSNRLPSRRVKRKERMSVLFTNLVIVVMVLVADRFIGWRTYLLTQLPLLCFAGAAGVWLFYVQHQFPGGYWARKGEWEPLRAAMEGSSFYKLPPLLRWFSSNIGYHHVHHLSPRIPNYHLKSCYDTVPALQAKVPLTIVIRKNFALRQSQMQPARWH